jgi:hypothetical protein
MYFDFIEYCYKRKNMPKNYIFYDNKLKYHDMINQAFPGFKNKLKKFEEKDKINSKIKKKFNGNIIMDHIHFLRGNELGEFINDYKKSKKNFDKFIIDNSQNEIISDFKKFYKNEFKNK